jgi:dTDP-4-dehydrorhamnose 3,5-epimerase
MRIDDLAIPGVKLITLDRFEDNRGFFCERWNAAKFKELGFDVAFAQDNFSRSNPGVLRGIHYQNTPPQGKLVGVTRGEIYDVAIDLRPESAHFGEHVGAELSDANGQLLWIPEGCGHAFCVLGNEPADVMYKVSGNYNPKGEGGIVYNDRDLNIPWPIANPVLSERDKGNETFAAYRARAGR